MKKFKNNYKVEIVVIFVVLLLGPATGLLLSKTNFLDKFELLNVLKPEVNVYSSNNQIDKNKIKFN